MTARDEASERQSQASDPAQSVWLMANAGSGKTKVLIDRVSRQLLAGTPPERILCLTYTKAAAGEMQNRLFARLGEWAMLPESDLRQKLAALGDGSVPDATLDRARRLFAQAIETPGGLKIQTIHAFCSGLLRRFPLEAGVSPGFTDLDEAVARRIRAEVVEEMADGGCPEEVEAVAEVIGDGELPKLLVDICAHAEGFETDVTPASLQAFLGVPDGVGADTVAREALDGTERDLIARLCPLLSLEGPVGAKRGRDLASLNLDDTGVSTLLRLEAALLTGEGRVPKKLVPADIDRARPELGERLVAFAERVASARLCRLALSAAGKSLAVHRFGRAFLDRYRRAKTERGALDYDDLILRAAGLFSDPSVAEWVLYKLDGGIDHILVDEAQDTSQRQWRIIERLTEEFTAGQAPAHMVRTLFVVGDKKQSIYSFQGADVREFEAAGVRLASRFKAIGRPMLPLTLEHSFRSSQAVLRVVDATFDARPGPGLGEATHHLAFYPDMPGRVDLWEAIPAVARGTPEDYDDPAALMVEKSAETRLASAIAGQISAILQAKTLIPDKGEARPARPGDFLILVQRRRGLYAETILACKAAGLPVAGSDQLKLSAELAVLDLASLLAFLSLPEDDLALAEALRSPLFGWSEGALFGLAHGRAEGATLWAALRNRHAEFPDTCAVLYDLLGQTDFLRPYELIERMLNRHDMRRKLLARLGAEAEDGIEELVNQALAHERSEVPDLTGFLARLQTSEIESRRRPGTGVTAVRVMTVHGAKGLEAPIVILPDTAARKAGRQSRFLRDGAGRVLWRMAEADRPQALKELADAEEERRQEELSRLLYVGMTRAACWLIVCGAGAETGKPEAWYETVARGVGKEAAVRIPPDVAGLPWRLRIEHGEWPVAASQPSGTADGKPGADLPGWASRPPAAPFREPPPILPASLEGAKALAGEAGDGAAPALSQGTTLHRLLEVLPQHRPEDWRKEAIAALDLLDPPVTGEIAESLIREAASLILDPSLGPLFREGLAEVEVAARVRAFGNRLVRGTIDRLIVRPDLVRAIDFKTNRVVPHEVAAVPEGLLRQVAAYHAMLEAIFPGREVEVAILWTRTRVLMPVDAEIVRKVLAATPIP
ncbi:MAG: double-strand break repair helicase AddA [Paracoccaceae bacterium]